MNLRKLKQLETHISGIRGEEYVAETHRLIYDEVGSIIGAPEPDRPSDIPPSLIFYAIRNIIHPAFIVGQIPDLLNLLTMVDTFRQFASNKSGEVLTWNKYFAQEQDNQEVTLLAAKEVHRLEFYQAQSERLRQDYILLLRNLCLNYIHYLWTAPESCVLAIRLNDFFPGSVDGFHKPSSFLFHEDLSEDEKRIFTELKDDCSTSMKTILEWESEREESGRQQGRTADELKNTFKEEFWEAFPPPMDYSDLLMVLEKYIKNVEDTVKQLEAWFPPSSVSGAI